MKYNSGQEFMIKTRYANVSTSPQNSGDVPQPPLELPIPEGAKLIELPKAEEIALPGIDLRTAIEARGTVRAYAETPLTLEEVARQRATFKVAAIAHLGPVSPGEIAVADETNTPLLVLPPGTDIGRLETDASQLIMERRREAQRQGQEVGRRLMELAIAGEPLPPPRRRAQGAAAGSWEDLLPLAMLFVFVGGGLLRALFGRLLGGALAGGVAFFGGWLLLGSASGALVIALGGSGGGFSGGGGGFGGGGASGRW